MPTDIDKLQIEIEADSAQAGSAIDRLAASLQRLQSAVGNNTALKQTSQQVKNIAKAPSLSRLEKELSKVEKQAIKDGDSLVALQKKLEELQGYKGVGNKLTQADTASKIKETTAQIRQMSDAVDTADAKIRELRQSIRDVQAGNIPTAKAPKASTTSKTTSSNIPQAAAQIRQAATATQGVSNAAAQVKTNLDAASKSANNFGKQVKKATSSGSGGFAYLARSIKGMVVNFALFGALFSLTNSIGDSFQRMAQENQEVYQTLSEIKSSLQYVSDALAVVIYPIVKAIAPILVTILDAVAGILNFIAMIVGFLTGQDSVIQAQKQWVDFSEGVDGATDSMGAATDAAKKLYRALLPIDELNVLEDNSTGGGAGGIGGTTAGGLTPPRFETVDLPFTMPTSLPSPEWAPDPVPAPSFAAVTVPSWAGALLPSPEWSPQVVTSPFFEALKLPEWALNLLPVPAWEEDPIPAPALDLAPVQSGLAVLQEAFAFAWDVVTATSAVGVGNVVGNLDTLAGRLLQLQTEHATALDGIAQKQESFVGQTQSALQAWSTATQTSFGTTTDYIQTITPPAFANASAVISSFVSGTALAIAKWGNNVMPNVKTTLAYIPTAAQSALQSAGESFSSWINATSSGFAQWGGNIIQNAGKAAEGLFSNIVGGLSAAWEQFVGFMRGIGEKISNWWSANKSWAAPAIGVGLAGITIGAIALSGGGALAAVPALAALASGGVLTEPTAALVGEYPGARRNPEIVTPQNLMYDTFRDAQDTDVVVNAIMAGVNQIVRAIQDSNVEVYVDGDGTATQNRRNRMYGKTLQYI